MKKSIFNLMTLILVLLFCSCKKEYNQPKTEDLQQNDIVVKTEGYIAFKNQSVLIEFTKKLMNPDFGNSFIADLQKKGFKKRQGNTNIYSRDPNSIYSLIFNQDGLLQVDNIIMKISEDDKFLYTLKEDMTDSATFNKLINEIYDGLKMNKISVDRNLSEEFSLIDFTSENPFGKLESLYGGDEKRPMFGTVVTFPTITDPPFYTGNGNCEVCTHSYIQYTTYIFWIGFPGSPIYTGTTCVSSTGC